MAERRQGSDRKAIALLVKHKHKTFGDFAEQFATNLSPGGMFIRSRQPQPVGTKLKFEVQIAGGVRVLRGTADVKWVRSDNDPAGPPGMGLQFDQLDDETRVLIDLMLEQKAARELPWEVNDEPRARSAAAAISKPPLVAPAAGPGLEGLIADAIANARGLEVPLSAPGEAEILLDELIAASTPADPGRALLEQELEFEVPLDEIVATPAEPPLEFDVSLDEVPQPEPAAFEVEFDLEAEPVPVPAAPQVEPKRPPPVLGSPPPALAQARPEAAVASAALPVFLKPPAEIDATGPIIGIDLGTSNSCVAVLSKGRARVLSSPEGHNTIPSIVSVTPQGKLLVGHPAKSQLLMNVRRTVYGAKRLMGRPYESPLIREIRGRFQYDICADAAGRAAVQLGDQVLSLEEVSGLILSVCKDTASRQLGQAVSRAVITVPAYYSEQQREAVRKAGALAGLKVERVLNEPTAAALAFGLNRGLNTKVLVYDLGGGTFDATVMRIEGNVFEVLATGGDTFLGGVDFDNQVVDLLLQHFVEAEKMPFSGDGGALARVSDAAERAKIALSERQSSDVHVPMLMMDDAGRPHDLKCTLTREALDKATEHLVARTLDVVRDVLLDAKLAAKDVDEVILVGGQSRMPLVREKLTRLFGKPAHASVNADEAVALGAALYSGSVDKVDSVVLIDVLPMTIGVGMPGGIFKRLIQRNTPLPAHASFSVVNPADGKTEIEFSLFQGEDASIVANEYLGTVRMEGLPPGPKGTVKVAVTVKLDLECVIHVEAIEFTNRKVIKTTLATRYTPEDLAKQLGVKAGAKDLDAGRKRELTQRSGKFWGFIKKALGRA